VRGSIEDYSLVDKFLAEHGITKATVLKLEVYIGSITIRSTVDSFTIEEFGMSSQDFSIIKKRVEGWLNNKW